MSTTKTVMTTWEFLPRVASALGAPDSAVPSDLEALADLICPALADYTRTRDTLITDCDVFGVPTTDADGPRSLYQMTSDVVKRWRSAADDSSDLAEVRSRLTTAGYFPADGEATGDLVARAIRDAREADDKRETAEEEASGLLIQRDEARTLAADLATQLNHAAGLIARMSATLSRLT